MGTKSTKHNDWVRDFGKLSLEQCVVVHNERALNATRVTNPRTGRIIGPSGAVWKALFEAVDAKLGFPNKSTLLQA